MIIACPRCGSRNLTFFQDKPVACNDCGQSISSPLTREMLGTPMSDYSPDPIGVNPAIKSGNAGEGRHDVRFIPYPDAGKESTVSTPPPSELDSFFSEADRKKKVGGNIVIFAGFLFLASIATTILLLMVQTSSLAGREVTLDEVFRLAREIPIFALVLCGGVLMQLAFAVVSFVLGYLIRQARGDAILFSIGLGVLSIILSFIVFGGLVGAIGGGLLLLGGGYAHSASKEAAIPSYLSRRQETKLKVLKDACPHCGSTNLLWYSHQSGRCNICESDSISTEKRNGSPAIHTTQEPSVLPDHPPPDVPVTPQEGPFQHPPTYQNVVSQVPYHIPQHVPTWSLIVASQRVRNISGNLVMFSGIVFILSIFTSIYFTLLYVRSLGHLITISELFDFISQDTTATAVFCGGIFIQIILCVLALVLGSMIKNNSKGAIVASIVIGIITLPMSVLIFGGFVGVIGGTIMMVGGCLALVVSDVGHRF